jgi:hypothetical protein
MAGRSQHGAAPNYAELLASAASGRTAASRRACAWKRRMIDAHFHSWLLSRGDYGWLTPALQWFA